MEYFVTVRGKEVSSDLYRKQAIDIAKEQMDKGKELVGIGKRKYDQKIKRWKYILIPAFFIIYD